MKIYANCAVCGKEFRTNKSRLKKGSKYCSRKCLYTRTNPTERFWSKVEKTESCWNWTGYISNIGYGQFDKKLKYKDAHRFSYFLHFGDFEKSLKVCHKCDNRRCVNPKHLFLGTQQQNIDDANKKGRMSKGIHRSVSKLEDNDIREIRSLHKKGFKQTEIAKRFNVTPPTIWSIVSLETWKHII